MAFQPVPSYADVSYSYYDEKTQTTKSRFNPVWLSWFLSLNGFVSTGVTSVVGDLPAFELLVGVGGAQLENLGTSGAIGDYLTSQGPGVLPLWSPPTGLGAFANNTIVSNISGGAAIPLGNTISAILDATVGNTRGSLITRQAAGWAILTPGAAGTKLTSGGAGADLSWV